MREKLIHEVINNIKKDYGEWLEHSDDPQQSMEILLASKIVNLNSHVEYLERRLDHVSRS